MAVVNGYAQRFDAKFERLRNYFSVGGIPTYAMTPCYSILLYFISYFNSRLRELSDDLSEIGYFFGVLYLKQE